MTPGFENPRYARTKIHVHPVHVDADEYVHDPFRAFPLIMPMEMEKRKRGRLAFSCFVHFCFFPIDYSDRK